MARSLTFEEVQELWIGAGAKNTLEILHWFMHLVPEWSISTIPASEVGDLLLFGGEDGEGWDAATGGSYRVADVEEDSCR